MIIDINLFNNTSRGSSKKILCKCDKCGTEKNVDKRTFRLLKNNTYTFCNHCKNIRGRMIKIHNDLTGSRIGKLLVLRRVENVVSPTNGRSRSQYECRCDCGKIKYVGGANLAKTKSPIKSCGCTKNKIRENAAPRRAYGQYKRNARVRNLKIELSLESFIEMTSKNCYYCGAMPSNKCGSPTKATYYTYNGLDRLDNSKDYTIENCVPCCFQCNRAKDTFGKDKFLQWVEKVYLHSVWPKQREEINRKFKIA